MASFQSTIDTLKSAIDRGNGLARSNRFEVIISLPPALLALGDAIGNARELSLMAQSCTMPGRTITTLPYQSVRQSVKIPTGYTQEDVTMTFLLTNDYFPKRIIDRWLNSSVDQETYRVTYDNYYCADIFINQLDSNDKTVYTMKLLKAWPISSESITLDHGADNETLKLSVTFSYEDFEFDQKFNTKN